jgi:hypothetical protein
MLLIAIMPLFGKRNVTKCNYASTLGKRNVFINNYASTRGWFAVQQQTVRIKHCRFYY